MLPKQSFFYCLSLRVQAIVSDFIWKAIWKLKIPGKVKHFFWRLAHNSHPLRRNLVQRGMRIETKCIVCDSADEDGGHLFFKCCLAKEVWRNLNLESFRLELATTVLVKDIVELILMAKEEQKLR